MACTPTGSEPSAITGCGVGGGSIGKVEEGARNRKEHAAAVEGAIAAHVAAQHAAAEHADALQAAAVRPAALERARQAAVGPAALAARATA